MSNRSVFETIKTLAEKHGLSIQSPPAVPLEGLGGAITRLAGDDPIVDNVDRVLIALRQNGHIDGPTFMKLGRAWSIDRLQYREI